MKSSISGAALFAACVLLAGCGGSQVQPATPSPNAGQAPVLMMLHHLQSPVQVDHGKSWMRPEKKGHKSILLYGGDLHSDDVLVLDYKSGAQVGTLTGFDQPYGMCVDAKGDVYITNFGNGTVLEYAHGGKTPIQTFDPGGDPIGCSVDAKKDLAVTDFDPGSVAVYAGGNPKKPTTYSDSSCSVMWPMGYDGNGNLIGMGEQNSIAVCALIAGSKTMTTLSTSGITIDFPGGTMWDGKYTALADQEAGGKFETGMDQASLAGSVLTSEGQTVLGDACYNNYSDIVSPFIVGKKNTPVNHEQGSVAVGVNLWCADAGAGGDISLWHYPQGGSPFRTYTTPATDLYSAAVSIGR